MSVPTWKNAICTQNFNQLSIRIPIYFDRSIFFGTLVFYQVDHLCGINESIFVLTKWAKFFTEYRGLFNCGNFYQECTWQVAFRALTVNNRPYKNKLFAYFQEIVYIYCSFFTLNQLPITITGEMIPVLGQNLGHLPPPLLSPLKRACLINNFDTNSIRKLNITENKKSKENEKSSG